MRAGDRRSLVSIQRSTGGTASGIGGQDQNWTEQFQEWAAITDLSGTERLAGSGQESDVRVQIEMVFRDGVTAAMRAVDQHTGIVYAIRAVRDPDHKRERLLLDCESGVAI